MKFDLVARELRHDVRNQLFALRTAFAALEKNPQAGDKIARSLGLCAASIDRLSLGLQEYFALESGEGISRELAMDAVVEETLAQLKPAAEALELKFEANIEKVSLHGRALLLKMALRRMISSVMGLAAGDGIKVSLRSEGDQARLEVSYRPRTAVAKEAVDESISALAVAEEVMALHGGSVRLEPGRLAAELPLKREH